MRINYINRKSGFRLPKRKWPCLGNAYALLSHSHVNKKIAAVHSHPSPTPLTDPRSVAQNRTFPHTVNCILFKTKPRTGISVLQTLRKVTDVDCVVQCTESLTIMSEGNRRNIPIKLEDFSVINTEFSSIRERFDAEMRKMEEEMSKFRSELMNRESNNFFRSTTRYLGG